MKKASHLSRCVKGALRNTKKCCRQFFNLHQWPQDFSDRYLGVKNSKKKTSEHVFGLLVYILVCSQHFGCFSTIPASFSSAISLTIDLYIFLNTRGNHGLRICVT